jgi:hypothetical protein
MAVPDGRQALRQASNLKKPGASAPGFFIQDDEQRPG